MPSRLDEPGVPGRRRNREILPGRLPRAPRCAHLAEVAGGAAAETEGEVSAVSGVLGDRPARVFLHGASGPGEAAPAGEAGAGAMAKAKPRSHDHGPHCGFFLGGIGGPAFSRNLEGRFDRWQLEPGKLARQPIDVACLMVRWRAEDGRSGCRRIEIGKGNGRFPKAATRVAALFPVLLEVHDDPALPFTLTLETVSPIIPGDEATSALPVTMFTARVSPRDGKRVEIGIALLWPNLLGWTLSPITTAKRRPPLWPNQSHAGQVHRAGSATSTRLTVVQGRETVEQADATAGEVAVAVEGAGWRLERAVAFKADQNALGRPDARQRFTRAHVVAAFRRGEGWEGYGIGWPAHWHEPLMSAVAGHRIVAEPEQLGFALALDIPMVRFGMGRLWLRRYTREHGAAGDGAEALAHLALDRREEWLGRIDAWHEATIGRAVAAGVPAGALVNELGFLTAGGTAWLERPLEPAPTAFRAAGHFGLLEGFDSGYYYYNTLDLWIYAFPALTLTFPGLAEQVFRDYLDTIEAEDAQLRPIYRTETLAPMLVRGKLPHDLGSPAEDPWVRLNGYVMRDDPNLWKDHNPGFLIAFVLHRHLTGEAIDAADYRWLAVAADFIAAQDEADDGAPAHRDFGDSTWDNIDIRGHSATATGLCLACWAALEGLAARHGDAARASLAAHKRGRAAATLDGLWTGTHWRCASEGKYRDAVITDSLIGPLYARLAGLGDLVDPDRARQHLQTVYATNFLAYGEACAGPLLVAEPGRTSYGRDGGEELQVNEVIVGSAWIFVNCLREWGLAEEAATVAASLDSHARRTGLQFRTPAAWTAGGLFRAPINMRPLAIWGLMMKAAPAPAAGPEARQQ
jgi:non-lysosomal glucosylceramidase